MQNTANTLSGRDIERIINNKSASIELADILFLKFSSDTGTVLNSGRRGSLFAPEAILALKVVRCRTCR
jgi:hypothetical protein